MKFWDWLITINIDWENAVITCFSAFLGAWFAYRFNLRQQKKWDAERKKEEEQAQQREQLLQLNYLQTYLHSQLKEFYDIFQKLNQKQQLYKRIVKKNYQLTDEEFDGVCTVFIDFSSQFRNNWEQLSFVHNNSEFISSLARVETSIHRFVFAHDKDIEFFGREVELFRQRLENSPQRKQELLHAFIDKHKYNNGEEIFRLQQVVVSIDVMLKVFEKYIRANNYQNQFALLSYSARVRGFVKQAKREVEKDGN
ncbi:MAG: hypothetical protein PUK24_05130 [Elusimicrobia bacterium]|nr:hypothetical protein [Elusimicrobiota bacterium]MDY6039608.1 hypothetical protein [Elusimicrobiaceae bacterium]